MEREQAESPARIMIVDDERPLADGLAMIFRKAGYACIACYSGETAVAVVDAFAPDLLLCDLSMQGMNGQATIKIIAGRLPHCRIIVFTGDYMALAHAQLAARKHELDQCFMTKPQAPLVILREVGRLLHGPRLQPAALLPASTYLPEGRLR